MVVVGKPRPLSDSLNTLSLSRSERMEEASSLLLLLVLVLLATVLSEVDEHETMLPCGLSELFMSFALLLCVSLVAMDTAWLDTVVVDSGCCVA